MGSAILASLGLFQLAFIIFMIASYWRVLEKAGLPGWGMFIPFYNLYLHFKMAGRSGWTMLLMLIPIVNIIILIATNIDIAKKFGQPAAFGLGMTFLGFIFYPILAFGDSEYQGNIYREEELLTEIGEDGSVVEKIEVDEKGQW